MLSAPSAEWHFYLLHLREGELVFNSQRWNNQSTQETANYLRTKSFHV